MGFDIYDGVAKTRSATLLGYIVRLYQHTKNPLKYVHTNSKYGHIVAIPSSDTQELFLIAVLNKVWVDKMFIHLSCGKEENKEPMAQYLSKYLLRNMKTKQLYPPLNVGCLLELP